MEWIQKMLNSQQNSQNEQTKCIFFKIEMYGVKGKLSRTSFKEMSSFLLRILWHIIF